MIKQVILCVALSFAVQLLGAADQVVIDGTKIELNNDQVKVGDTTDSSDKDTGALVVEGGVGIEKKLNVGGDLAVTGALMVDNQTATPVYQFRTHGTLALNTNNTYKVIPFSTMKQEAPASSGDFNSSTGVFTAPEDGLYSINFMSQLKPLNTNKYFTLNIEHSTDSGSTWTSIDVFSEHQTVSGPHESASMSVYWAMDDGDQIRCSIKHSDTGVSRDMNKASLNIARVGNK